MSRGFARSDRSVQLCGSYSGQGIHSSHPHREVFLEDTALGEISSIAYGHLRSGSESVIAVVGQTGAIFLNERADQIETVSYEREATSAFGDTPGGYKRYGKIQIVDVDSLVRWPTTGGREYVLHKTGDRIMLIDFAGKTVAEYRAPLSARLLDVYGTTVKLRSSEGSCFAAVAVDSSMKGSVLYIYDSAGELIYQELLAHICSSIAAFPTAQSGTEALLLGCEGRVFQYDLRTGL